VSTPETSPPGDEEIRLEARASEEARIYQAGRDQHIAQRDLHLHYEDGVRQSRRAAPDAVSGECPYPGLAAFGEDQARWFFGRDAVTAELLVRLGERLSTGGALALVAPSGAGKSSLLRAGLLPALARGALPAAGSSAWPRLLITPGAHPLAALAACRDVSPQQVTEALVAGPQACVDLLGAAGGRLVVVVDQLEELFTLCADERERRDFLEILTALADAGPEGAGPAALVVYGLRSDFYTPCADYPQLRAALQDGQLVVGPMTRTELREAILFPARAADLEIEPGLVELLLRDLGADQAGARSQRGYEAGRLPLLAHALRATWQQRHGHTLTVDGYQATGGIHHAVATTAERLYAGLEAAEQLTARTLFLRLVRIGDTVDDTRRRLPYTDLLDSGRDPAATAAVVDAYTRGRLLTRHQDTVEITHEALLHAWPELRRWIDTDRAGHLVHQDLEEAAINWERAHRDPGMLYRGHRLEAARAWADRPHRNQSDSGASPSAAVFLTASTRHAHRAAQLRRAVIAVLTALSLIASSAAVIAFQQRADAQTQRATAQAQRDQATFSQIKAEAGQLRDTESSLAAQLDLVAHRLRPDDPAIRTRLISDASNYLAKPLPGPAGRVDAMAFSPRGPTLAVSALGVQLWDLTDGRPKRKGPSFNRDGVVASMAFSPVEDLLVTGGQDSAQVWDVADPLHPKLLGQPFDTPRYVQALAFSQDGHMLATCGDKGLRLWHLTDRGRPELLGRPLADSGFYSSVAFSRDGGIVAAAGEDGVRLWDLADREHPKPLDQALANTSYGSSLAFSPSNNILATGDKGVQLWDLADREHPKPLGQALDSTNNAAMAFSPSEPVLAIGGDNGFRLWNLTNPAHPVLLDQPVRHVSYNQVLAFSWDGRTIASTGTDDRVMLWTDPRHALIGHAGAISSIKFSRDGRTMVSVGKDGIRLWSLTGTETPAPLSDVFSIGDVSSVALSPDGCLLAAGSDRGVRLWDLTDPKHRKPMGTYLNGTDYVASAAFSPDGSILATGDWKGARLWDMTDPEHPKPLGKRLAGTDSTRSVAFGRGGRILVTIGDAAQLWDLTTPKHPKLLGFPFASREGIENELLYAAFSSDDDMLAFGATAGAELWKVTDLTHPLLLDRDLGDSGVFVTEMEFSRDGRILATAGQAGVRLWGLADPAHPEPLGQLLTDPGRPAYSAVFSSDGHTLVSGGSDGSVRLWETDIHRVIRWICDATGDTLTRKQWKQHVTGLSFDPPCR
jgi:WD40 repeat protein